MTKRTSLCLLLLLAALLPAAAGEILYGYATTPRAALQFAEPTQAGMAFQFTARDVTYFRGCRITAIAVANGRPAAGSAATSCPVSLFTASEITDTGTALGVNAYEGTMDLTRPFQYTEYPLPTPIEITAETAPFWVGVNAYCDPAQASPLAFDSWRHNDGMAAGMVGVVNKEGADMQWVDMSADYGYGCIRVKIEGPRQLITNEASFVECHIPYYTPASATMDIDFAVLNDASNPITTLTMACTLGTDNPIIQTYNFDVPLIYNDYRSLQMKVPVPAAESANLPVSFEIKEVNGEANGAYKTKRISEERILTLRPGSGYPRAMVAEFSTGNWCGFCPMGFVAVPKMLEEHPDGTFIPIAVHVNDDMQTMSYDQFRNLYTGTSAPSLVVNRNISEFGIQQPDYATLSAMYPYIAATPAMARLSVKSASLDGKKLLVEASAEFALDCDGDFALSYVLTEDHVGPGYQVNYYCRDNAPEMGVWNTLPEVTQTEFGSVARHTYVYDGVAGSIPAQVEAGKEYLHTGRLATNAVQDLNNCHVIVMLINRATSRIENAVSVPYSSLSALPSVPADVNEASSALYDLQGRRVSSPASGLYIRAGRVIRM